jgi:hypothetical protein
MSRRFDDVMRRIAGVFLLVISAAVLLITGFFVHINLVYDKDFSLLLGIGAGVAILAFAIAVRIMRLRRNRAIATACAVLLIAIYPQLLRRSTFQSMRQQLTMANMRALTVAIDDYATRMKRLPRARTVDELTKQLSSSNGTPLPTLDGWKRPLRYEVARAPAGEEIYLLGSAGRDGRWERAALQDYNDRYTTNPDSDIILRNEYAGFIQSPDGLPRQ